MRYLDPVSLAKLRGITLQLRRALSWAPSAGRHRSGSKGFSHDFAQHRAYSPGDELKSLDWKVYARQDRFYVKEFNEELMVRAQILVDASGSMGFGGKWEFACRLAMAMAYLMIVRGDAAGLLTFDTEPRAVLPPRSGFGQLEAMDSALSQAVPAGETDLGGVLEKAAGRLRRRSLIVVVSDLLGDSQRVRSVLKAFKARKHDLLALQVLDPRERSLDWEGPVVFEGLEDRDVLHSDADAIRRAYAMEFERLQRLYEAAFQGSEIGYGVFYTDVPWDMGLARLLSRR